MGKKRNRTTKNFFEGQGLKEGEFDYGGSCCDSALKSL